MLEEGLPKRKVEEAAQGILKELQEKSRKKLVTKKVYL